MNPLIVQQQPRFSFIHPKYEKKFLLEIEEAYRYALLELDVERYNLRHSYFLVPDAEHLYFTLNDEVLQHSALVTEHETFSGAKEPLPENEFEFGIMAQLALERRADLNPEFETHVTSDIELILRETKMFALVDGRGFINKPTKEAW